MEDLQNDHSVQTSASQSILSMTWKHLRPLVKTACRVASIAAARGDRHIEKIGTATTYIVEIVEVPVLAFGEAMCGIPWGVFQVRSLSP